MNQSLVVQSPDNRLVAGIARAAQHAVAQLCNVRQDGRLIAPPVGGLAISPDGAHMAIMWDGANMGRFPLAALERRDVISQASGAIRLHIKTYKNGAL